MSFPSSIHNTGNKQNKQNIPPNFITRQSKASPWLKSIQHKSNIMHNSFDLPSLINSIQPRPQFDTTQRSIKTIIKQFCHIPESQSQPSHAFCQLVKNYLNNSNLSSRQIIEYCQSKGIYNRTDLQPKLSSSTKNSQFSFSCIHNKKVDPNNFRKILGTDLGQLKIQQLCQSVHNAQYLSQNQQKMIEFLISAQCQEQITQDLIWQSFQALKDQLLAEELEKKKIHTEFWDLHRNKIQTKLWSDHIRLQLSKVLTMRSQRQTISLSSLIKSLDFMLNKHQIGLVFKYIYSLEKDTVMTILDPSKRINTSLLMCYLLKNNSANSNTTQQFCLQSKNQNYIMEEQNKKIEILEEENKQKLEALIQKDKQVDRLNRIISLIETQKQQNQQIYQKNMEIKMEVYRNKYEKRIDELQKMYQQQKKLTQWYQRELESLMKNVHRENIIQRVFHMQTSEDLDI